VSRILEKAFVVFALLYLAGGLTLFLDPAAQSSQDMPSTPLQAMVQQRDRHKNSDPTQKNPTKLIAQIAIYLVTGILILRNRREYLELARCHKLLWALLALTMLSAFWSEVPGFTLRRSLVLIASTSLGVYLGVRYTMREIIRMICIAGGIAAVASLLAVWLWPDIGVSGGATDGAWQGIFGQKNTLGAVMSLASITFAMAAFLEKRHIYVAGAVLCFALVVLSRDASAMLMTPLLIGLIPILNYGRKHSLGAPLLFAAAGAIIAVIILSTVGDIAPVLRLMDKDTSLSGRTEIWSLVWQKFLSHPWLGYGYSAFWLGADGKQSADIWAALHWAVPHSHNGFLDLLADLGLAGFCLFLAGFVACFRQAVCCARLSRSLTGVFPLIYLSLMILFNLSEGSILRQESLLWVLYAAIWVLTTRWLELATSPEGQRVRTQFGGAGVNPGFASA
jgi:exopolysaccharide production protein ExoQ